MYYFKVYYRCVVDTLVYCSDYYYKKADCIKAALDCEDDNHYAVVYVEKSGGKSEIVYRDI